MAGRFYLRFNVEDRPSVLAEIATILGRENISISSVIQHEAADESGVVPLVVMTHKTTEGATNRATDVIDRLPFMRCRQRADARSRVAATAKRLQSQSRQHAGKKDSNRSLLLL